MVFQSFKRVGEITQHTVLNIHKSVNLSSCLDPKGRREIDPRLDEDSDLYGALRPRKKRKAQKRAPARVTKKRTTVQRVVADAAGSSADILEISDDNDDDDGQQNDSFCNIVESSEDDVMTLDFTLPLTAQR